jgi:dTDP-4-dehydrorhamnose 3,5-epimerase
MGAIYDVVVDLRPSSPTYLKHFAIELTQDNHKMLYVPEGCAHGFQTLVDDTEVAYQMSEYYSPECSAGHRWNDPAFGIDWPLAVSVISQRDSSYPDFSPGT